MAIPDYQTLMLPVLRRFGEGATNIADCLPKIVEEFGITPEEEREMIPSGRVTLLANRVHWARTYLSKAGLLASPRRNLHEITPEGRAVLARRPERIDNAFLSTVPEFREWRARSAASSETDSSPDPPGVAEKAGSWDRPRLQKPFALLCVDVVAPSRRLARSTTVDGPA